MNLSDWPKRCTTTRLSLVLAAQGDGETARIALGELYRLYFWPVFALYARRRGVQLAAELTQAFFTERLANGRDLARFDLGRATRFRHWLLRAANRYFCGWVRSQFASKRDARVTTSFEEESVEIRSLSTPAVGPEQSSVRADLFRLLQDILEQLRERYCASAPCDRESALRAFEAMKPFLPVADMSAAQCQKLAEALGVSPNAAKQKVYRWQQSFLALLGASAVTQYGFDDAVASLKALRERLGSPPPELE